MWITVVFVAFFCFWLTWLFARSQYFYLHSFFLIPCYPVIFFIDHNAHYVFEGLQSDSLNYVVKLLPLYLNSFYLLLRFRQKRYKTLLLMPLIVNGYLAYSLLTAAIFSFVHASWLPLFYASYSIPLFALFFNSRNLAEEVDAKRGSRDGDTKLLEAYFAVFVFVYAASLAYSISTGITKSLLDSRSVGSVFASTSTLIYCTLYAPLLVTLSNRKWPHVITLIIGVVALSKTVLLMVPGYLIVLFGRMKARFGTIVLYAALVIILCIFTLPFVPDSLLKMWEVKFALDDNQTFFEKAYLTRTEIYSDVFSVIMEHPLGIGIGNFERHTDTGYRDSHNFILNTIAESGWIVGVAFCGVFLVGFVRTAIQIKKGHFEFQHFSFLGIFLIYIAAGGVLLTTGTSDFSTIYYTPFYGVAILQFLNLLDRTTQR
jgi:hypothetical protein